MSQPKVRWFSFFCISLLALTSLLTNCIHTSFRKEAADHIRAQHIEKVKECLPAAEAFIKSQEVYKLDQDELLDAFNAVYGIFYYFPDRGGHELEYIFNRFDSRDRTRDMANNVFSKYIQSRDLQRARDFAKTHGVFNLNPPPLVIGTSQNGRPEILRVVSADSLSLETFADPIGPAVYILFSPECQQCSALHSYLLKNKKTLKKSLSKIIYLIPQHILWEPEWIDWVLKNPIPATRIVYHEKKLEFLKIEWDSIPKLYFFNKNNLLFTLESWSAEDGPAKLQEGLQAIGLK